MMKHRFFAITMAIGMFLFFFGCAGAAGGGPGAGNSKDAAAYAKPGFYTQLDDGRVWVFQEGSKELEDFRTKGKPAKHTVRPGAGPGGITLRGPDSDTLALYIATKPGFYVALDGGRLWVFEEGSKELEDYRTKGKPAKHTVRPGAGPEGMTLRGPDGETLDKYMSAK